MAKVLAKLGRIKCHCCGSLVILKKQANGLPIYTCQECDCKLQAFSSDSGRRLLAQCVETFGEAAKHAESGETQVPPKKQSLGAALGALLDM